MPHDNSENSGSPRLRQEPRHRRRSRSITRPRTEINAIVDEMSHGKIDVRIVIKY
jgi:hypothetical protein